MTKMCHQSYEPAQPIALARCVGYNAKELHQLREVVAEHKNLFLKRWYEYFGS
jgi:hypothetical protein